MVYPQEYAPNATSFGPRTPSWKTVNGPYPDPLTYSEAFAWGDYSSFVISLGGSNPFPGFYSYLESSGLSEATFEFGVQIVSLDFTPVPEPGTMSLAGLTLLVFAWQAARRRRG